MLENYVLDGKIVHTLGSRVDHFIEKRMYAITQIIGSHLESSLFDIRGEVSDPSSQLHPTDRYLSLALRSGTLIGDGYGVSIVNDDNDGYEVLIGPMKKFSFFQSLFVDGKYGISRNDAEFYAKYENGKLVNGYSSIDGVKYNLIV